MSVLRARTGSECGHLGTSGLTVFQRVFFSYEVSRHTNILMLSYQNNFVMGLFIPSLVSRSILMMLKEQYAYLEHTQADVNWRWPRERGPCK